jgi:cell division transport system permease protein
MPWVIAIMVALTVVAAGGALSLSNMVSTAQGDLSGNATVQIVEPDAEQRAAQTESVLSVLAQDRAVAGFRAVPEEEIAKLLEPWLGTGQTSEAIPLPAIIDVEMRQGADDEDYQRLRMAMRDVASDARIDAQSEWLVPVLSALSALKWIAFVLIAMLAVVAVAAVWLASRNALGGNRDTVEIVHLLGGSDDQIARIFQRSILIDASLGGLVGFFAGILIISILAVQFTALQSGMVAGGSLLAIDWFMIVLVPLCAVGIAVYTARMTVLSSLRKSL